LYKDFYAADDADLIIYKGGKSNARRNTNKPKRVPSDFFAFMWAPQAPFALVCFVTSYDF
jgi:hypothetical protein